MNKVVSWLVRSLNPFVVVDGCVLLYEYVVQNQKYCFIEQIGRDC